MRRKIENWKRIMPMYIARDSEWIVGRWNYIQSRERKYGNAGNRTKIKNHIGMHTKNTCSHCTIWLSGTSIRICVATRPLVFVVRTPYTFCCRGLVFIFWCCSSCNVYNVVAVCVCFFSLCFHDDFEYSMNAMGTRIMHRVLPYKENASTYRNWKYATAQQSALTYQMVIWFILISLLFLWYVCVCHWIVEYFSKYIWKRWMV